MNKVIIWFLMLMYGAPTTALLILDATEKFVRIREQPSSLILFGIGYAVVLFGFYVIRLDKKEEKEREELRQKLGGEIITVTLDFEDTDDRFKWNVPVNKIQQLIDAINSLKLNENNHLQNK